ncbi:hypothetical protein N864_23595 [Intrasporangium chromatireducens Q5-1]|uniref:Uncharacterized protein n=1 Tax=Intrasporangium chromatireducens Q5-1 TaxID=584657 RepID=W9GV68_9MICO|nr:hypothetical protein [Intrasporangium chromatireducens]EWT07769.1 hypothetical protein N864_23595 [Intrasporangium chromatireducens Q5-1]
MTAIDRVRRNFWVLVAATILSVGILSQTLRMPAGHLTALLTAVSAVAALASLSLAGRILVVSTRKGRAPARRRAP